MQELTVSELLLSTGYGMRDGMGIELYVPIRSVRDRVHYEDLNRQPYTPPHPGLHHRNETLTKPADPQLALHFGHNFETWTIAGRTGVAIPLGRTEPNPFALGEQGLWHQHIQFGNGTWDPLLGVAFARGFGAFDLELDGFARLTLYENDHGYQAGNRYFGSLTGSHPFARTWKGSAGLVVAREMPERWDGLIETEGNLGRTDVLLSLTASYGMKNAGAMRFNLQVPIASHSTGEQVTMPLVFAVGWER